MKPPRRILVIDDTPEDRRLIRRLLSQDDAYANEVVEAASGEQGLAACQSASFDAVLLDQHLPGMDGLAVLRALRALPGESPPIIFLSGVGHEALALEALEGGAQDYLVKDDISAPLLSRALTHAMTKERLRRQVEAANQRTARLLEMVTELSGARALGEVMDVILRQGMKALGANAGFVALLSEDGRFLEMQYSPGFTEAEVRGWRRIPLSEPVPVTEAVRTGESIVCATREEQEARFPRLRGVPPQHPALAALPLRIGDVSLGVVALTASSANPPGFADREFLLVFAGKCAQALERARLYEALRHSEERQRLVMESARLGWWECDVKDHREEARGGRAGDGARPVGGLPRQRAGGLRPRGHPAPLPADQ